jgi:hypothetical protein
VKPSSFHAPSIGAERFTDEFLENLRGVGDDPADAAVKSFFDQVDPNDAPLFPLLVRTTHANVSDEEAPGVGPYARQVEPWPSWVDESLVRRGQAVFGQWGLQLSSGLFMASLPMSYACAKGAEPLVRTARLTSNPKRRYLETGQMIIDAMTPRALEPGARGYLAVRHVRLIHAAVRYTLLHPEIVPPNVGVAPGPWDTSLGVPLNQEDLLGCLFAFNVIGLRSLKRAGVTLSSHETESYVHVWNVVGHQLGVRDDLLPLDFHDASIVAERILARQSAPSEAGSELTATAVEAMQDLLKLKFLKGLPASGIRYYIGDHVADMLQVRDADWTRRLFPVMRRFDVVTDRLFSWLPGNHSISAAMGRRIVSGFEDAERGGGRPSFQITDELRDAWGMGVRIS